MKIRSQAILGLGILAGLFVSSTVSARTPPPVATVLIEEVDHSPMLCMPSDVEPRRGAALIRLRGGCRARLRITLEIPEWLGLTGSRRDWS